MKALTETEIMEAVRRGRREGQDEMVYIRANRCGSLYDSLLALRGWQREEINQVHQRACQMDKDGQALRTEHLYS